MKRSERGRIRRELGIIYSLFMDFWDLNRRGPRPARKQIAQPKKWETRLGEGRIELAWNHSIVIRRRKYVKDDTRRESRFCRPPIDIHFSPRTVKLQGYDNDHSDWCYSMFRNSGLTRVTPLCCLWHINLWCGLSYQEDCRWSSPPVDPNLFSFRTWTYCRSQRWNI